ncbi:hypothetical protein ACNSN2_11415 [Pseudoalteromonas sp. US3C1013]|uniref:hypothetical protein n=1 Tax=unclassified Pseudoalteromonas TaxID=194690 RepID=UPI003AB39CA5
MKTDAALKRKIELDFGKSVKIARIREHLCKMVGVDLFSYYNKENPEGLREVMFLLYKSSQVDGGKTSWRDRLTLQLSLLEYSKENFTLFAGSNREVEDRAKPILNFNRSICELGRNGTLSLKRNDCNQPPEYIIKVMVLEKIIQDYINSHQRKNFNFNDDRTLMDDGLDGAINAARKVVSSLKGMNPFYSDSMPESILKKMELNLIQNDLLSTIKSAKKNRDISWFDSGKFITALRKFNSLDSLELSLTEAFYQDCIPDSFSMVLEVMLGGYVQKRLLPLKLKSSALEALEAGIDDKLICELSFFLMAFVLISTIENKTKITVNVTGDTNKERPIYHILESQIYNANSNDISKISPDVIDYVFDKFASLATLPINSCLETGNKELLASSMKSYANYRALKFEFINELYTIFSSKSLNYIDQLLLRFMQVVSSECENV